MAKSRNDEEYDEGYNDGKEADMLQQFVQNNKDLVPFPDRPGESSYDGGFKDGVEDHYDDENSHYQGGNHDNEQEEDNDEEDADD